MSLDAQLAALPGDVALASAFMSYAGPFPSQYREDLAKQTWQKQVSMRQSCHVYIYVLVLIFCDYEEAYQASQVVPVVAISSAA